MAEANGAGAQRAGAQGADFDVSRRLQMLNQEYAGLNALRSLAWGESFSRATMFLTVLSATVVALALMSQAVGFGQELKLVAVVLLSVALFVGAVTYVRIVEVNSEDIVWVAGLNRVRHAWTELDPGISPYLVTGFHDDEPGLTASFGHPGRSFGLAHAFVTVPGMIGVVDAVVAAGLAALVGLLFGQPGVVIAVLGVVAFMVATGLLALVQVREIARLGRTSASGFPTPKSTPDRGKAA